ncbi:uncharacterized protein LOC125418779 [Ziziphus jujuba]|uniref:Uncharacterized protein LOC125418779 n=1 Tax=Ziziphus jujuba TaxID=326968 RepID=A0ABM3I2I3_ZIZJJ|nr:uncharacterized protein LOC125418779 [Ziziphus jujuba]
MNFYLVCFPELDLISFLIAQFLDYRNPNGMILYCRTQLSSFDKELKADEAQHLTPPTCSVYIPEQSQKIPSFKSFFFDSSSLSRYHKVVDVIRALVECDEHACLYFSMITIGSWVGKFDIGHSRLTSWLGLNF